MRLFLALVLSSLAFSASAHANKTSQNRISIMTYNLENLFDEVNDGLRNETVLTPKVLDAKLTQLSKGILQINNVGPDILITAEVENLRVLKKLNEHLKPANYQTIELLESDDERGIDVGIISRFPLAGKVVLHRMPFSDVNPTRGILEVPLQVTDKKVIHVFALHFPSQANPTEQRRQASEFLRKLMSQVPTNAYAVAGGDFNITKEEEAKNSYFSGVFEDFKVSHLIGCKNCDGTYFYKNSWSFLDALITRENSLVAESVRTPNKALSQINSNGSPRHFEEKTGLGISDHLPLYGELIIE